MLTKYTFPSFRTKMSVCVYPKDFDIDPGFDIKKVTPNFVGLSEIGQSDTLLKYGFNPKYNINELVDLDFDYSKVSGIFDKTKLKRLKPYISEKGSYIGIYATKGKVKPQFYVFIALRFNKVGLGFHNHLMKSEKLFSVTSSKFNDNYLKQLTKQLSGRIVFNFCRNNALLPLDWEEDVWSEKLKGYGKPLVARLQYGHYFGSCVPLAAKGGLGGNDGAEIVLYNVNRHTNDTKYQIQYNAENINVYELKGGLDLVKNDTLACFQTFIVYPGYTPTSKVFAPKFNPTVYCLDSPKLLRDMNRKSLRKMHFDIMGFENKVVLEEGVNCKIKRLERIWGYST